VNQPCTRCGCPLDVERWTGTYCEIPFAAVQLSLTTNVTVALNTPDWNRLSNQVALDIGHCCNVDPSVIELWAVSPNDTTFLEIHILGEMGVDANAVLDSFRTCVNNATTNLWKGEFGSLINGAKPVYYYPAPTGIRCPADGSAPVNGTAGTCSSSNFTVGDSCIVLCDSGLDMHGNNTRVCGSNGVLTPITATCDGPPAPCHGTLCELQKISLVYWIIIAFAIVLAVCCILFFCLKRREEQLADIPRKRISRVELGELQQREGDPSGEMEFVAAEE